MGNNNTVTTGNESDVTVVEIQDGKHSPDRNTDEARFTLECKSDEVLTHSERSEVLEELIGTKIHIDS